MQFFIHYLIASFPPHICCTLLLKCRGNVISAFYCLTIFVFFTGGSVDLFEFKLSLNWQHSSENEMVYKNTQQPGAYFNAGAFLGNKTRISKSNELLSSSMRSCSQLRPTRTCRTHPSRSEKMCLSTGRAIASQPVYREGRSRQVLVSAAAGGSEVTVGAIRLLSLSCWNTSSKRLDQL